MSRLAPASLIVLCVQTVMSKDCLYLSLILGCLLFCGSAVLGQEETRPGGHVATDHGDARFVEGHHHESEDPDITFRQRESFFAWMFRCMGPIGLLIPIAGMCCFALTIIVVIRGQGPFAFAALVFLVPIPFWLGLFGTVQGMILSLQVVATSSVAPKASEISDGIATSLFNPMLGLLAMTPSYIVAALGSTIRSLAKPT